MEEGREKEKREEKGFGRKVDLATGRGSGRPQMADGACSDFRMDQSSALSCSSSNPPLVFQAVYPEACRLRQPGDYQGKGLRSLTHGVMYSENIVGKHPCTGPRLEGHWIGPRLDRPRLEGHWIRPRLEGHWIGPRLDRPRLEGHWIGPRPEGHWIGPRLDMPRLEGNWIRPRLEGHWIGPRLEGHWIGPRLDRAQTG
ncbi:hypothetical protein ACOMHN_012689 [Nucella lapillus]